MFYPVPMSVDLMKGVLLKVALSSGPIEDFVEWHSAYSYAAEWLRSKHIPTPKGLTPKDFAAAMLEIIATHEGNHDTGRSQRTPNTDSANRR